MSKPQATSATVWRVADAVIGPCFDVECVECILKVHVLCANILYCLKLVVQLPNRANRNAKTMVKARVEKSNIRAVRFCRERIVAVVDGPVLEKQIRRKECVSAVRICCGTCKYDAKRSTADVSLTARYYIAGVIDEDVLPHTVVAVDDRHGPHLTPQEPQTLYNGICQSVEGNLVGTTWVVRCVGLLSDPLIPVVSIAVECANSVAINADIVASKDERCGLVLVSNR